MKRWLLFSILALLLLASPSWGQVCNPDSPCVASTGQGVMGAGVAAAPACTTQRDTEYGAANATVTNGAASRIYIATKFTANGDYTYCGANLSLTKTGSPTMNLTVCIYTHDGVEDDPADAGQVGTCSDAVAASSVGTSETEVSFSGMSAGVSSGTVYWIVLVSSAAGDVSNNIVWNLADYVTEATERVVSDVDASGTWGIQSSARVAKHKLFTN